MSLQLNGDTGVTFNDASLQGAAASPFGLKNRLINADMRIDQRNAGASVTPTSGQYCIDRWVNYVSQASKYTVQQNAGSVTPPAGFTNYLGVTSTSSYSVLSGDYFIVQQRLEGFNVSDLDWGKSTAKTITISFWVRSSLTGTFGGVIKNAAGTYTFPFGYTISSANTWTQISFTVPGQTSGVWPTDNSFCFELSFSIGAGSSNLGTANAWVAGNYGGITGQTNLVGTNAATWYVTGVQLEIGSTATPFERRLYGQELINCQRYYAKLQSLNGNYIAFGSGYFYNTTTAAIYVKYPVAMRAAPTASVSNVRADCAAGTAPTTLGTAYYGSDSVYLNFTGGSGITTGQGSVLMGNNNANAYVDFSAEL
jgi:hypothetical protein